MRRCSQLLLEHSEAQSQQANDDSRHMCYSFQYAKCAFVMKLATEEAAAITPLLRPRLSV